LLNELENKNTKKVKDILEAAPWKNYFYFCF
jgi:hypothetical protein